MADLAERFGHDLPEGHPLTRMRIVTDDEPVITSHDVQAAAEGVVHAEGDYVDFFGEKFRLAEKVGLMPMLAYANASKKGLDSDDVEGLAAMYSLIRSVIHRPPLMDEHGNRVRDENGRPLRDETEWQRFQSLGEDELADGDDVMGFVSQAMEIMSARPTAPRAISSDGSRPTSPTSRPVSSLRATIPGADELTPVAELGR